MIMTPAQYQIQTPASTTVVIEEVHEVVPGGDVILTAGRSVAADGSDVPDPAEIRLRSNGDIVINGRVAENDKQVVAGLRNFLKVALDSGQVDPASVHRFAK